MKKLIISALAICLMLCLSSCVSSEIYEEPIGQDWHVHGLYDFYEVGETKIAVGKVYDDDNQCIGYDIYADGSSLGALLGEIRCSDGGFSPEDLDIMNPFVFDDCNNDGTVDIGVALKSGETMWYAQKQDEYNEMFFAFETSSDNKAANG